VDGFDSLRLRGFYKMVVEACLGGTAAIFVLAPAGQRRQDRLLQPGVFRTRPQCEADDLRQHTLHEQSLRLFPSGVPHG
jgi:hypothetical protein